MFVSLSLLSLPLSFVCHPLYLLHALSLWGIKLSLERDSGRERKREGQAGRQADRQTDRDRQRERERERGLSNLRIHVFASFALKVREFIKFADKKSCFPPSYLFSLLIFYLTATFVCVYWSMHAVNKGSVCVFVLNGLSIWCWYVSQKHGKRNLEKHSGTGWRRVFCMVETNSNVMQFYTCNFCGSSVILLCWATVMISM